MGSGRQRDGAQAVQRVAALLGWLARGSRGTESSSGCAGVKATRRVPEAVPARPAGRSRSEGGPCEMGSSSSCWGLMGVR